MLEHARICRMMVVHVWSLVLRIPAKMELHQSAEHVS